MSPYALKILAVFRLFSHFLSPLVLSLPFDDTQVLVQPLPDCCPTALFRTRIPQRVHDSRQSAPSASSPVLLVLLAETMPGGPLESSFVHFGWRAYLLSGAVAFLESRPNPSFLQVTIEIRSAFESTRESPLHETPLRLLPPPMNKSPSLLALPSLSGKTSC